MATWDGIVVVAGISIASYYVIRKLPLLDQLETAYSKDSGLYVVPEAPLTLPAKSSDDGPRRTFSIGEISISVPTHFISEVEESTGGHVTVVLGPDKKMLTLLAGVGCGELVGGDARSGSPFYTEEELRSCYDFTLATMQETPGGFTIWSSWESLVRASVLLALKSAEVDAASTIRPLSIGTLKAIKIGDATGDDEVVRVFVFPSQYEGVELVFRAYTSREIADVLSSLAA